jgi:hypothetical protein
VNLNFPHMMVRRKNQSHDSGIRRLGHKLLWIYFNTHQCHQIHRLKLIQLIVQQKGYMNPYKNDTTQNQYEFVVHRAGVQVKYANL